MDVKQRIKKAVQAITCFSLNLGLIFSPQIEVLTAEAGESSSTAAESEAQALASAIISNETGEPANYNPYTNTVTLNEDSTLTRTVTLSGAQNNVLKLSLGGRTLTFAPGVQMILEGDHDLNFTLESGSNYQPDYSTTARDAKIIGSTGSEGAGLIQVGTSRDREHAVRFNLVLNTPADGKPNFINQTGSALTVLGNSFVGIQDSYLKGKIGIETDKDKTYQDSIIDLMHSKVEGEQIGAYIPAGYLLIEDSNSDDFAYASITGKIGVLVRGAVRTGGYLEVSGGFIEGVGSPQEEIKTADVDYGVPCAAVVFDINKDFNNGTGAVRLAGGTFLFHPDENGLSDSPALLQTEKGVIQQINQFVPYMVYKGRFSHPLDFACLDDVSKPSLLRDNISDASKKQYYQYLPKEEISSLRQDSIATPYDSLDPSKEIKTFTIEVDGNGGSYNNLSKLTYKDVADGSTIFLPVFTKGEEQSNAYKNKEGYTVFSGSLLISNSFTVSKDDTLTVDWEQSDFPHAVQPADPSVPDSEQVPSSETLPANGPGLTQKGSTTVGNTDGKTSTTFSQSSLGVKARTITDNITGLILYSFISIPDISGQYSMRSPIELSLMNQALTKQTLRVDGNRLAAETHPIITFTLPEGKESAYVAIPITVGTGKPGTIAAVRNSNNQLVPVAKSIMDEKNSRLLIEAKDSQTIEIIDNAKTFLDQDLIPDYGQKAAAFLSARSLMTGAGSGENFQPLDEINRAQLATIIYRFQGEPDVSGMAKPADVPEGTYYTKAATWMYQAGFMGQGSAFNAMNPLTREQLATVLFRYHGSPQSPSNGYALYPYLDQDKISPYAKDALTWAVEKEIMGKGTRLLDPQSHGSRAQIAAMLQRYIQDIYEQKQERV